MVCREGRGWRAFRRASRAGGISERRREVKMSARFAVCVVGSAISFGKGGWEGIRDWTYLELLLRF